MNKKYLLLAALLLVTSAPAQAGTTFDSAVADYNNHNYGSALDKLQKLERANPNNEQIHYYMALSFQGADQIASAREEYSWVSDNAKSEQLKQNANTALQNIAKWSRTRNYAGNGNYFAHNRINPAYAQLRRQQQLQQEQQQLRQDAASGST
ncbi:MAG TPA: hypothetical protein V6D22_02450 [Candidatus Obscuribacterales bacterium]